LLASGSASAATIAFDELPNQAIDGLSFNGVTFGFTIGGFSSGDAFFNAVNGPDQSGDNTQFLDLHTVEGSAFGVLTMEFANPISFLQFGAALDRPVVTLTPGFTVDLFNPSFVSSTGVTTSTQPGFLFTEALFTYSGAPITRASVSFDAINGFPEAGGRFAVDNLTYEAAAPVPEPASLTLLGLGAAAMKLARRRFPKK
jgi:hypothetical protein